MSLASSIVSAPKSSIAPTWTWTVRDYDLAATLTSGQTFSWRPAPGGGWHGWIGDSFCHARQEGEALHFSGMGLTREAVADYFQLELDLERLRSTFPSGDAPLLQAIEYCPGLRLLRQDPWETTASFICSSLKQISQIQQINHALRQSFGGEIAPRRHRFPDAATLAEAGETALRACKLGFRARHLAKAARQIAGGEVDLSGIAALPTPEAKEQLLRLGGVGEKVANCILLFAYGRLEAFPVDVWVERALLSLYFPKKRRVSAARLRHFAATHFGPHGGFAQQYLFHWVRTRAKG